MRVTHVITRLIVGGAQENTVDSVLGLRLKPDLTVDLISGPTTGPEGSLEPVMQAAGGLTIVRPLVRAIRPVSDLRAYLELRRLFRSRRPDVVHTHSGKAGILGRLAARTARVPLVVHSIHGPSFGPFQGPLANAVFTAAERVAGRVTDHFVTVADAMRDQYLAAGIGPAEKYTRIFSGFRLEPFLEAVRDAALAERLGIGPQDFVVGKIARLFELKGHDDLFAAAPELIRRIPGIRFLLVGDGPWRSRFEAMAAKGALRGRFLFTGLVPPESVPSHVALMHCLVHLSRREGLPRALPQALAGGRPVVACDADGAGEVCREGETGFLVKPGDVAGLVDRLTRLASDPALRDRLGAGGRAWVSERFSVRALVDAQHALYLRLAAQRAQP
ncbi:MAG: glycosyltransferase family 4 protein [Verrucomicrobiae bacterium]|nr:glycosyltransferase family 4 protein [Verrucomicrobiae bacterium]